MRLLADSGFGGRRSLGWGRSEPPEFIEGSLPELVLPAAAPPPGEPSEAAADATPPAETAGHWLLSLYSPAPEDAVDWSRGQYDVIARGGRVESPAGHGQPKKQLNMIGEGSVLVGAPALRGTAPDVAPDGFPHPVYRAGFAVALPVRVSP